MLGSAAAFLNIVALCLRNYGRWIERVELGYERVRVVFARRPAAVDCLGLQQKVLPRRDLPLRNCSPLRNYRGLDALPLKPFFERRKFASEYSFLVFTRP